MTDRIASRSQGVTIVPVSASAVRSPWIENHLSDAGASGYYVVAMTFLDSDGATQSAVWGVRTAAPLEVTELEVRLASPDSEAIVSLDETAHRVTDWPDYARIEDALDQWTLDDVGQCLDR
ncbi:hypothetical protein IEU95_06800 [Hoyosella rhizosphaerae]|uniref:hypothetical protein n=1 Tax=Hoyosella rhizosphaerae TaxID=1755582 RepID=UPI001665B9CA|nr:hypothetical protein [Hoyosella rhizosphaerae]MBN4926531.1 hypothetical protein [Hoyosella rhizosphaerae]